LTMTMPLTFVFNAFNTRQVHNPLTSNRSHLIGKQLSILLLLHNSLQLLRPGLAFSAASSSSPSVPPRSPSTIISASHRSFHQCNPSFLPKPPTSTRTSTKMGLSKEEILSDPHTAEDPYLYLEEVESDESIAFAKSANEKCLARLGDPSETETYERVLKVLTSDDRIPHVSVLGYEDGTGEMLLYNFWRDSKNPKGLWRKTTLSSYQSTNTEWTTVLDLDELAKKEDISWVWKGYVPLPRSLDPQSGYEPHSPTPKGRVTRVLLNLSRGGADAIYLREFDLLTESFVDPETEQGFSLPEGKTRARYKSRDVLLVGANVGENALTDSGYPRTIREWTRGTAVEDAPIVYEAEKTDVSCSSYLADETHREGGAKYEMRARSMTFYNSEYYLKRITSDEEGEFVKLTIALNTDVSLFGKWMMLYLKEDWSSDDNGSDRVFKSGSLIYVDAQNFLDYSKAKGEGQDEDIAKAASKLSYHVLFEPTATTSYDGYSATKNYLILDILDDVKQHLKFYKLGEGGGPFVAVGGDEEGQLRAAHASGVDSKESDLFWLTCSSYTQPSTLYLADASKCSTDKSGDEYIVRELKALPHMYDSSNLEVSQHFATSEDGTKIPFFMVSKKGLVLDGSNPTLLYGYGGFEISLTPRYISTVGISWLERGGVYVEANIRGGGEYGPDWHQVSLIALFDLVLAFNLLVNPSKHFFVSVSVCSEEKSQQMLRRFYSSGEAPDR